MENFDFFFGSFESMTVVRSLSYSALLLPFSTSGEKRKKRKEKKQTTFEVTCLARLVIMKKSSCVRRARLSNAVVSPMA